MTLERILSAAKNSMIAPDAKRRPHCYHAHVPGKGYVNDGALVQDSAEFKRQLAGAVQSEIDNMSFAPGYAEPGYEAPRNGVLLANWNRFPRDFDRILERAGYAVEWSDEWSTCDDCNRLVRTSPDSYSWTRSYYMPDDCSIVCKECAKEDEDAYISDYLLNDCEHADTFDVDLSAHGFARMPDTFESGFHPGQNDNPRDIAGRVPTGFDYVFQIADVGQFDVRFTCWIRPEDEDTGTCAFEANGKRYAYIKGYLQEV